MTYTRDNYYEDPKVLKWIKKKYAKKQQRSAWQRDVNRNQMLKELKQDELIEKGRKINN